MQRTCTPSIQNENNICVCHESKDNVSNKIKIKHVIYIYRQSCGHEMNMRNSTCDQRRVKKLDKDEIMYTV